MSQEVLPSWHSLRDYVGGGTASLSGCTTPSRVPGGGTASLVGGTTQHYPPGGGTVQDSVSVD